MSNPIWELADTGGLRVGNMAIGLPPIPQQRCPTINPDSPKVPYDPIGPRGWQDEYCEWAVARDPATNKITKVMFTCENPEYWYTLWLFDPDLVTSLYQSVIHPNVKQEDLYLYRLDAQGNPVKPVIDPSTGRPAYNPLNKWNKGTQLLTDSGGAIHLTSPPNTLGAEIYLAAAATILRELSESHSEDNPQNLICCSQYGRPFRNSDPHIGYLANQITKALNALITLTNPVGLYIQQPDFGRFTLPEQAPKDSQPGDFWRIVHGSEGYALHVVYEVPPEMGFVVGDILIDGQPIQWGAQIPWTFKIGLQATAIQTQSPQTPWPCYTSQPDPLPAPQQLMYYSLLKGYYEAGLASNTSTASPVVNQGEVVNGLVLICPNATADATIEILGGGVDVDVLEFIPNFEYQVPGSTNSSQTTTLFLLHLLTIITTFETRMG